MKAIPLLLIATTLHGAEPRFQVRSFIQIDGSLMHVKLDTTTGQTWRLERTLTNRRDTTLAGKATERKLAGTVHASVDNLDGYRLSEILPTMDALNHTVMGKDFVPTVFRKPAANLNGGANQGRHQIVPPTQQFGAPPVGIDPNTGRPFPRPGQPQPNPRNPRNPHNPNGSNVDPTTGLPVGGGGLPGAGGFPAGGAGIDPRTGLPLGFRGGGLPGRRPGIVNPVRRIQFDADTITIRNWGGKLRNISTLDLYSELLNSFDAPLRCVIDDNIVYLIPESATLITRDGKINKPKYEERWVEIKAGKKE